jgi:hypothetical protein
MAKKQRVSAADAIAAAATAPREVTTAAASAAPAAGTAASGSGRGVSSSKHKADEDDDDVIELDAMDDFLATADEPRAAPHRPLPKQLQSPARGPRGPIAGGQRAQGQFVSSTSRNKKSARSFV